MSIFSNLLEKVIEIYSGYNKTIEDELQRALAGLDKFGDDYVNGKLKTRDLNQKNKNATKTLQSINEDEDEPAKVSSSKRLTNSKSSKEELKDGPLPTDKRQSKKRSKDEMEGMSSPELDKRPKRHASVRAQGVISKQVNVNLSTKMRREEDANESTDKRSSRRKGRQQSDKENTAPVVQVKQEKESLPPEGPMDFETANIPLKQEANMDDIAMPPPAIPVPKPRGRPAKPKEPGAEHESDEESGGRRRTARGKKNTDQPPPPPPPPPEAAPRTTRAARSTRASSRNNTSQLASGPVDDMPPPPPPTQDARPKRTRAKKKVSEPRESTQDSAPTSPTEKPRPKRTRRGQKAVEKEKQEAEKALEDAKQVEEIAKQPKPVISPKEERTSVPEPDVSSPILQKDLKLPKDKGIKSKTTEGAITLEQTHVIASDVTVNICNGDMDQTVILPNGKYNHEPMTPNKKTNMNETVVIDTVNRETMVLEQQPPPKPMDATVVLNKEPPPTRVTDDNSLMTDDDSSGDVDYTPPGKEIPEPQPVSAVKVKVQQFEEMATRVTRTKTRANAKKEEEPQKQSPAERVCQVVLSAETLTKMSSLIFNGKPNTQISSSAYKPRANLVTSVKSLLPASTSKLAGLARHREAAEDSQDSLKREKEDARKKKEALLDAKKELQKRKREEKMAAAAAAREAAERERQLQLEAAARERQEKQAHADQGKLERLKEAERKKHELARKVAETEERRRAEERARQARLAEEQRRADTHRKRQHDEQEATKKEAAVMAKEIEKRHKEYIEKQKLKQKIEADKIHTPLRAPGTPSQAAPALPPVHMCDGFEQLNSDDDEDAAPSKHPVPLWSTPKVRWRQLMQQAQLKQSHVDRLFSVRVHSPDLRHIFPAISSWRLKRTSSAVWRTPPRLAALAE